MSPAALALLLSAGATATPPPQGALPAGSYRLVLSLQSSAERVGAAISLAVLALLLPPAPLWRVSPFLPIKARRSG